MILTHAKLNCQELHVEITHLASAWYHFLISLLDTSMSSTYFTSYNMHEYFNINPKI